VVSGGAAAAANREACLLLPPVDPRVPLVRVRTRQWARLAGQRVVVAVDGWPADSAYPNGHIVRVVGDAGDWRTEVRASPI